MEIGEIFTEATIEQISNMATLKKPRKAKSPVFENIPVAPAPIEKIPVDPYPHYTQYLEAYDKRVQYLKDTFNGIFGEENVSYENLQSPRTMLSGNKSIINSNFRYAHGLPVYNLTLKQALSSLSDRFIVKFPEITVKRHTKHTHTMYDSYVKFEFNMWGSFQLPYFRRGKKSYVEYQKQYNFSHADRGNNAEENSWYRLCFGSTDLNTNIMSLYSDFNENILEMVLHSFQDYLSWESKDGGPYVSITDLVLNDAGTRYIEASPQTKEQVYLSFINSSNIQSIPLKFTRVKNMVTFLIEKNNMDMWKMITSCTPSAHILPLDSTSGRTFYTGNINENIRAEIRRLNAEYLRRGGFKFKGEIIKLQITDNITNQEDVTLLAHETIRDYVIDKFVTKTNKYFINECN